MNAAEVVTFGCRLNAFESSLIREKTREAGLENAVVFNTCAVTAQAVRQARQAIRRARREKPSAKLIVTGCAVHTDRAAFAAMPEVDRLLENKEKVAAEHYRFDSTSAKDCSGSLPAQARSQFLFQSETHSRAFLQIQNGCNHSCTFCIIPFTRGPSRSVPLPELIAEARLLVSAGYNEIVLTGVDISDYGKDLHPTFGIGALVRCILDEVPELQRLRLSSVDCIELDDDLFHAFAEDKRLMPHLHISLQSGDDLILKRMKRRHLRRDAVAFCKRMRLSRPDVVFGADLIAGFPTETESMFENSLSIIEECGIAYLHVFPYSARPGTPAARMPQLRPSIVHERAATLRNAGQLALERFLKREVGHIRRVLVERGNRGHTEHHASVRFSQQLPPGTVVDALLTRTQADYLEACAIP